MKNIIRELYRGNIDPHETPVTNTPEMKQLIAYISRHHGDLADSFTDEQKQIFDKYADCCDEYQSLHTASIFEYAFKLGALLMLEILTDDEKESDQ